MSNSIDVRLAIVGETTLPTCVLSGINGDLPVVTFEDSTTARARVEISLGNHPDPSRYLMDLAERLADFAVEVSGAAAEPIPFTLTEKAASR